MAEQSPIFQQVVTNAVVDKLMERVAAYVKDQVHEEYAVFIQELAATRKTHEHVKTQLNEVDNTLKRVKTLMHEQHTTLHGYRENQQKTAHILDATLQKLRGE